MRLDSDRDKALTRLKRARKNMELVDRLRPTFVDRRAIERELAAATAAMNEIDSHACEAA